MRGRRTSRFIYQTVRHECPRRHTSGTVRGYGRHGGDKCQGDNSEHQRGRLWLRLGLGSAAEYLRLRREELEEEKKQQRERQDEEQWIEAFGVAGGERSEAKKARRVALNEQAALAAALAEEAAIEQVRSRIGGSL
jgi:hypothetical protein